MACWSGGVRVERHSARKSEPVVVAQRPVDLGDRKLNGADLPQLTDKAQSRVRGGGGVITADHA